MTHCHVGGKDGISHKSKRVACVSLRASSSESITNSEGENEAHEQQASIGIPGDGVDHFDCLPTDDGRILKGIGKDKERNEEVALVHTQTR